jgi:tRNA(fMet)-specific endonuclease VapC
MFLAPLAILPFDDPTFWAYGDLRADLERRGTPIGSLDTMIAAHALSQQATLITNNIREFAQVPGLHMGNIEAVPEGRGAAAVWRSMWRPWIRHQYWPRYRG